MTHKTSGPSTFSTSKKNTKHKERNKSKAKGEAGQVEQKSACVESIDVEMISSSCLCYRCIHNENGRQIDCVGEGTHLMQDYRDDSMDSFDPTDHPEYFDSYAEYAVHQEMHRYRDDMDDGWF